MNKKFDKREYSRLSMAIKRAKDDNKDYHGLVELRDNLLRKKENSYSYNKLENIVIKISNDLEKVINQINSLYYNKIISLEEKIDRMISPKKEENSNKMKKVDFRMIEKKTLILKSIWKVVTERKLNFSETVRKALKEWKIEGGSIDYSHELKSEDCEKARKKFKLNNELNSVYENFPEKYKAINFILLKYLLRQ